MAKANEQKKRTKMGKKVFEAEKKVPNNISALIIFEEK